MSLLKFTGVQGHLIPKANSAFLGQFPEYVGFAFDGQTLIPTTYEVDETSQEGLRLLKLARRDGSLAPADERTANLLGVPWAPAAKKAKGE